MTLSRLFWLAAGIVLLSAMGGPLEVVEIGNCSGAETSDGVIVIDGKCGPFFGLSVIQNEKIQINLPPWNLQYFNRAQLENLKIEINGTLAEILKISGNIALINNRSVSISEGVNTVYVSGIRKGNHCDATVGCGDCREFEFRLDVTYNFLVTPAHKYRDSGPGVEADAREECITTSNKWSRVPVNQNRVGTDEGYLVVDKYELPEIRATAVGTNSLAFRAELPAYRDADGIWDTGVFLCEAHGFLRHGLVYDLP